jgi:translation elongation factor P/translation initiation factor 5A
VALRQSDFTLVGASELRKGGYVLLPVSNREEPCRIGDLSTSKTGKHGHAKISVTATDVASGRKVERNLRADEKVTVPGKRWIMAIGGGPVAPLAVD